MNIFALLSLFGSITIIFLGNFILYQNKKRSENILFFLLCLGLSYWSFAEFMWRQAGNLSTANFWIKISSFWIFTIAFLLNFVLVCTVPGTFFNKKLFYFLIYTPALLFSFIDLATHKITLGAIKEFWGYNYLANENSLFYWLERIWAIGVALLSVFILAGKYFKSTNKRKQKQFMYMCMGFAVPVFAGLLEIFLPVFKIKIPGMTTIFFTWLAIFVGYAVWKYQLFVFSPETAAGNIISSMTDSLILISPEAKILTVNQATLDLLGYKKEELLGQPVRMIFVKESESEEEEMLFKGSKWEKLLKEGSVRDFSMTYRTKNGESIPVSFFGSVMMEKEKIPRPFGTPLLLKGELGEGELEGGKIVGIVGIARDIRAMFRFQQKENEFAEERARGEILEQTKAELEERVKARTIELEKAYKDLKTAQEQIIQTEKLAGIGLLAGGIAHELNNPLTAILGNAQLLLDEIEPGTETCQNLKEIETSAKRCREIIRQLLAYSRKSGTEFVRFELNELLSNTLIFIGQSLLPKSIKVIEDFSDSSLLIKGNPQDLQRVFINILSNACDAMPAGGELTLRTGLTKIEEDRKEMIYMSFRDTGPGIAEEMLVKIFDPFFTTKPVGKGTGLGLSICQGIIKQHAGEIIVKSAPGKGTEFIICFPKIEDEPGGKQNGRKEL